MKVGAFIHKVVGYFEDNFKPDVIAAANAALPVTEQVEKALESKEAIVFESLFPATAPWAADAILACKGLEPALRALSDKNNPIYTPDGVKGLLQRLGSQITAIAHGGNHPFGFYVQAFETTFDSGNKGAK